MGYRGVYTVEACLYALWGGAPGRVGPCFKSAVRSFLVYVIWTTSKHEFFCIANSRGLIRKP